MRCSTSSNNTSCSAGSPPESRTTRRTLFSANAATNRFPCHCGNCSPSYKVIPAGLDDVELIAAAGAMLVRIHHAGGRIDDNGLYVPVAISEDLGQRVRLIHERVVFRHGPVGVDAYDLRKVRVQLLRVFAEVKPIAEAEQ